MRLWLGLELRSVYGEVRFSSEVRLSGELFSSILRNAKTFCHINWVFMVLSPCKVLPPMCEHKHSVTKYRANRWVRFLSIFFYGFEAISIILWREVRKPEPCFLRTDGQTTTFYKDSRMNLIFVCTKEIGGVRQELR